MAADGDRFRARWRAYLDDNGLNTTQQRELIIEQFLRCRDHVSIEDLLARVKKRNPKIGYATVYRTLKLLVDAGLAAHRQFGEGQARFELAGSHHDHLICTECGHIVEFEDEAIEDLQDAIARRFGFQLQKHRHELYGVCGKCQSPE